MARALCGCRVAGSSRERQRAGKLFLPSGDQGREKGKQEGGKGEQRQTERPNWWPQPKGSGSIWKATLYCTPCCFNQWQACSQSLEQQWLFLIGLAATSTFPAPLHPDTSHQISEEPRSTFRPLRKPEKWMCRSENLCTVCEVERLLFCNDDLIRLWLLPELFQFPDKAGIRTSTPAVFAVIS